MQQLKEKLEELERELSELKRAVLDDRIERDRQERHRKTSDRIRRQK